MYVTFVYRENYNSYRIVDLESLPPQRCVLESRQGLFHVRKLSS